MKFSTFAFASITLLGALYSSLAHAYVYKTCNGSAVTWRNNGHYTTVRNTCSIPDGGDTYYAYWNAVHQWRSLSGVIDNTTAWPADRCYISHGDGSSEVALVARSVIDGNNGLTLTYYDGCPFWFSTENITEADVMVANDMPSYYNPDESQWADWNSGRMTFIHEFGHAHGLDHDNVWGVMRTVQPRPYVGGTGDHVSVLPDDAAAIRFLYGSPTFTNLFASSQKIDGSNNVVTGNPAGTITLCKGATRTLSYTFGNTGNQSVSSMNLRLSMTNQPPNAGWDLGNWSAWIGGTGQYTGDFTVTIPSTVPTGIHWLYFNVDSNNVVAEQNESDNVTHSAMTINVINCFNQLPQL